MKVREREAPARADPSGSARRFGEALRAARRSERGPRASPGGAELGADAAPAQALGRRRSWADQVGAVLRDRRGELGESERRAPPAIPAQPWAPQAAPVQLDPARELRALVRTLPLDIEASRVREGEPLTLSLGRALAVDLRRGAEGLEVVLRTDAGLRRAAAAELPGLVAALRERGIPVARAAVRTQPDGTPPARRPAR